MRDADTRQLLELAAKAAGLHFHGHRDTKPIGSAWVSATGDTDDWLRWNPLADDGDALRLAVRTGIHVTNSDADAWASHLAVTAVEPLGADPCAATRRAIVRAAAAIGEAMPTAGGPTLGELRDRLRGMPNPYGAGE